MSHIYGCASIHIAELVVKWANLHFIKPMNTHTHTQLTWSATTHRQDEAFIPSGRIACAPRSDCLPIRMLICFAHNVRIGIGKLNSWMYKSSVPLSFHPFSIGSKVNLHSKSTSISGLAWLPLAQFVVALCCLKLLTKSNSVVPAIVRNWTLKTVKFNLKISYK